MNTKTLIIFLILTSILMTSALTGCYKIPEVYVPEDSEQEDERKENRQEDVAMVKNPRILPERAGDGAADPYILRYNGWYYLYTTGVVNIWKSKDLVDWTYVGTANNNAPLSAAYAPEVYYWNGKFYMYTSPAGNGHYVLEADNPEGPFNYVTDNFGLAIDGSVFIEDDGSWYFTRAHSTGIIGHKMISPTEVNPNGTNLKLYMGHWTEGPMIIKRDGRYYMTYTGNHFQSKGYRVNYAVAEESPFGPYHKPDNNPILINDMTISRNLGHSSFVYGPDLDSMYIAYHSYTGNLVNRVLNIDRLSFNGSSMYVNGPTWFDMPAPCMPDFALWPEDDPSVKLEKVQADEFEMLLSAEETNNIFTAEWNFAGGNGDVGVVFCKNEIGDYIRLLWLKGENNVVVERYSKGQFETLGSFELPQEFNRSVLHTVKVQYSPELLDVYFDGMHRLSYKAPGLDGGKIGYIYNSSQPEIGFVGFSSVYKGSGDYCAVKPIPGKFGAVHHLLEEGRGFGGKVLTGDLGNGVKTLKLDSKGAWVSYSVSVEKDGTYGIALCVSNENTTNIKIEVLEDGKSLGIYSLKTEDSENVGFHTIPLGCISLQSGIHKLSLRLVEGNSTEILAVELYEIDNKGLPLKLDLTKWESNIYTCGNGSFDFGENGMSDPKGASDIKMTVGSRTWTDYIIDVDVIPGRFAMGRSGVIFRTVNESYHMHQNYNAMQGYFAGIDSDGIFLKKVNYENTEDIVKVSYDFIEGKAYHLRIETIGNSIKIYVSEEEDIAAVSKTQTEEILGTSNNFGKPVIKYFDPEPFLFGRVGIWSFKDVLHYKNLEIRTVNE
jgi:xylan 1,4-beta-xylosidase